MITIFLGGKPGILGGSLNTLDRTLVKEIAVKKNMNSCDIIRVPLHISNNKLLASHVSNLTKPKFHLGTLF